MRPNQNRRMRGRSRPKGPNPLTRSYESNGPDVKIRGTAQHIADKYAQLARDALASGDPIAAENYFQHGEHYFRIITSAQDVTRQASSQGYARNAFEDEDEGEDDGQGVPLGFAAPNGDQSRDPSRQGYSSDDYNDPGQQPQPYERHDFDNRQGRNDRQDRRDRFQNRSDRPQRFDNNRQDYNRSEPRQDQQRPDHGARQERGRQDHVRQDYGRQDPRQEGRYENGRGEQARQDEGQAEPSRSGEFPRRDRRRDEGAQAEETSGLPAFLMTSTRNPSVPEPVLEASSTPEADKPRVAVGEEGSAPARKPRRRRTRYKSEETQEAAPDSAEPTDAPVGE